MNSPHIQALRGNLPRPVMPALPTVSASAPSLAFYLAFVFVFVVYARFPEIMDMVTGSALHSVRVLMVFALLAVFLFGGAIRAALSKVGVCLLAFTVWLCICTPFSIWRGGSVRALRDFWALSLFSFVIIAASVQGLEQCRKIMYSFAAATLFIQAFTFIAGRVQAGRLSLLGGTLGNANYLAMMLLMGVPFCLFVVRTRPGMSLFKLACILMILVVPVTVATTGSRGALVTLAVMFLLYFIPLPVSQKLVVGVVSLILAVVAITWSTRSALDRYRTFFDNPDQTALSDSERSAIDSTGLRKELLLSSLQLTMRHPLFGVGPGMFEAANANYTEETTGKPSWNAWHETHNTFTQLSCEDGLPGLLLYLLAMVLCFRIVFKAGRLARQNPELAVVGHMAFALRLALVAFIGTALFSSNAYAYYFPMLAAVCVALDRTLAGKQAAPAPVAAKPVAARVPVRPRPYR